MAWTLPNEHFYGPSLPWSWGDRVRSGMPVAIFGSPAGGVHSELAKLGGVESVDSVETKAKIRDARLADASESFARNITEKFGTYHLLCKNKVSGSTVVLYTVEDDPVVTLNSSAGKNVLMWDPPELIGRSGVSLRENWGGSGGAYALTAGAVNYLLASRNVFHAKEIDLRQTMNATSWRERGGVLEIMAANLEEGLCDDADMTRHAVMVLPTSWKLAKWSDIWANRSFEVKNGQAIIDLQQASSALRRACDANTQGGLR